MTNLGAFVQEGQPVATRYYFHFVKSKVADLTKCSSILNITIISTLNFTNKDFVR